MIFAPSGVGQVDHQTDLHKLVFSISRFQQGFLGLSNGFRMAPAWISQRISGWNDLLEGTDIIYSPWTVRSYQLGNRNWFPSSARSAFLEDVFSCGPSVDMFFIRTSTSSPNTCALFTFYTSL